MHYICSRCKLTSHDGNLWCQEVDCPAGTLPELLSYGDYLGNIKIVELLRVMQNSALYKAQRGENAEDTLFIKVANPGDEFYLQNEAEILRDLTQHRSQTLRHMPRVFAYPLGSIHRILFQSELSALPEWRPHGTVSGKSSKKPVAYGTADHRGQQRFFYLMKYVEGEFLSDYLLSTPQPWHQNVGWFVMLLAKALTLIHRYHGLHINLNPDVILVYRDAAGLMLPLLLDMGHKFQDKQDLQRIDIEEGRQHMLPAYTPLDFIEDRQNAKVTATSRFDVYGLGLILYEMLVGEPAHPYKLRNTTEIERDIRTRTTLRVKREDLPDKPMVTTSWYRQRPKSVIPLTTIAELVLQPGSSETRLETPQKVYNALYNLYGDVRVTSERNLNWYMQSFTKWVSILLTLAIAIFGITVVFTAIFTR